MRFWKNCVLLNQEGKQPGTEGKGNVLSDVVTETRRGSSEEEAAL